MVEQRRISSELCSFITETTAKMASTTYPSAAYPSYAPVSSTQVDIEKADASVLVGHSSLRQGFVR